MIGVSRFIALWLLAVTGLSASAEDVKLRTFKENVWMCVSPQVYDEAMAQIKESTGKDIEPVKKELSVKKKCMFIDTEIVEGMMAPYALVLKREGSKVQVQFVVAFRKRIELLHRLTNRYVLVGWTEEENLVEKRIM